MFTCLALGYLGAKPAEGTYVFWARVFTFYYFAHFLIVMPILGSMETPKSLPGSITESVLGKGGSKSHSSGLGGAPAGATAAPEDR